MLFDHVRRMLSPMPMKKESHRVHPSQGLIADEGIFPSRAYDRLRPIKEVMGRNLIDRSARAGYGDPGLCNPQICSL